MVPLFCAEKKAPMRLTCYGALALKHASAHATNMPHLPCDHKGVAGTVYMFSFILLIHTYKSMITMRLLAPLAL